MRLRLTPGDENCSPFCRRLVGLRVEGRVSVAPWSPRDSLTWTSVLNPRVLRLARAFREPEHVRQIAFLTVSPSALVANKEGESWRSL